MSVFFFIFEAVIAPINGLPVSELATKKITSAGFPLILHVPFKGHLKTITDQARKAAAKIKSIMYSGDSWVSLPL
jgi:hypothetical protein